MHDACMCWCQRVWLSWCRCCDGAGGAGWLVSVIRDVELKRALSADLEATWSPDDGDSHLTLLALRSAMQVGW